MKRTLFLFSLFFILLAYSTHAQNITLKGRAVDADTKEGLPFASVYIVGTTIGASTDIDGYYEFFISTHYDSIGLSAIGYDAVFKTIAKDELEQTINFSVTSSSLMLDEIVVIAGENPANAIVKGIIEHKNEHRLDKKDSYQYESYEKVEFDLENLGNIKDRKLLQPFEFVFENIDSTSDEKPFLPVYFNEKLADNYFIKGEGKAKEIVKAQRTSAAAGNKSVVEYISQIHQDYSVYDNWIYVMEKPFASPFSNRALANYEYYILDSAFISGQWSYQLKFKPKRKQENTFFGEFWVADSTFAVQRVNMRMSPDVNMNLVNRIIIYQEFDTLQNYWVPRKEKLVVDFTATEKSPGIIGRYTGTYRDHIINHDRTQLLYTESDPDYDAEDVKKDDAFWDQARHETLTSTEKSVYAMVDSIQNVPAYKTYVQVLETIFTGYFELGKIAIGPYYSILGSTPVEGMRLRIGARTTKEFSKKLRLKGFVAYGFDDEDFKFGGEFIWRASKKPLVFVGAAYRQDISLNSESSEDFQSSGLFSNTFRRDIYQKLIKIDETKAFIERYWNKDLSNKFTILHRNMDPYGQLTPQGAGFNYAFNPNSDASPSQIDTTIQTTEFIIKTRFAPNQRSIDASYERVSLGSSDPVVELQYTMGVKGLFGSNYSYHKLAINYEHYIQINPFGWLNYRVNASRTIGTVPFLLMEVHPGNESYVSSLSRFNTMGRYEFASDRQVSIFLEHHLDGFILNRIPLIRKLNWRTLLTFKAVIGDISEDNKKANLNYTDDFSGTPDFQTYTGFTTPAKEPFMEAGVGIENIFKVFRVEAVWRLNYFDNPDAQKFSIMAGVGFNF